MTMKATRIIIIAMAAATLCCTGCYTKFYRPGMEQGGNGPYESLYNRYDSTAIDTTLRAEDWQAKDSYPDNDNTYDRWSYWGSPRGRTRWGFDFYNFSPDYYWSYYGFNDYYGTPWWYNPYWDPWYGGHGNGTPGIPGEPPSRRPGKAGDESGGSGGGSYASPPPQPASSPAYAQPQQGQVQQPAKQADTPQKRSGKKGG
jgi:hypothetical protein